VSHLWVSEFSTLASQFLLSLFDITLENPWDLSVCILLVLPMNLATLFLGLLRYGLGLRESEYSCWSNAWLLLSSLKSSRTSREWPSNSSLFGLERKRWTSFWVSSGGFCACFCTLWYQTLFYNGICTIFLLRFLQPPSFLSFDFSIDVPDPVLHPNLNSKKYY